MFNHLTNTDMIAVANNSVVVINNLTSRRASVIARRTNCEAMGVIKVDAVTGNMDEEHRTWFCARYAWYCQQMMQARELELEH